MKSESSPLIHSKPGNKRGWRTPALIFVVALVVAGVLFMNRAEERDRISLSRRAVTSTGIEGLSHPVRADNRPKKICVQGMNIGGFAEYNINGIYKSKGPVYNLEWYRIPIQDPEVDQLTITSTSYKWWIRRSNGEKVAFWTRTSFSRDPVADSSEGITQYSDAVTSAINADALITKTCLKKYAKMCIRGVQIKDYESINGDWEASSIIGSVYSYKRVHSGKPRLKEVTLEFVQNEFSNYQFKQGDKDLAYMSFRYGDVIKNLKEGVLDQDDSDIQMAAGSFEVTSGACPAKVDLKLFECEYALVKMDAAKAYIDDVFKFENGGAGKLELQLEIDYLKWYYDMYAFNDIVKDWNDGQISVDIKTELDNIFASTWTNLVEPFEKIASTYDQLLDAHTTYVPPSNRRIGSWVQPVVELSMATTADNEFAVFGKTSKELVEHYKTLFGDASWVWGDDSSTEYWQILKINDESALNVLKKYANDHYGLNHDPATRISEMLDYADFSTRLTPPDPETMKWEVCDPDDCDHTTKTYTIKWFAVVKLACAQLTMEPTTSPTTSSPTKKPSRSPTIAAIPPLRSPTLSPTDGPTTNPTSTKGVPCEIKSEDSVSSGLKSKDAFAMDEQTIRELNMGIEDFTEERSSLRGDHVVVTLKHLDVSKIASKGRVLLHEYKMLSRPIALMNPRHRYVRSQSKHINQRFVGTDFVYVPQTTLNTYKSTQEMLIHIPTFDDLDEDVFRSEFHDAITEMHDDDLKLVIDLTDNGGGSICLGYGLLTYLLGAVGYDSIVGAVPYDMVANTKFQEMGKIIATKMTDFETRNECPANPCGELGDFAPCRWGFRNADWITTNKRKLKRPNLEIELSQRLSFSPQCDAEPAKWAVPPTGAGVSVLNKNNLLLVSNGYCGSTCAVFSSFLHANGYAELGTYGGLWTNKEESWQVFDPPEAQSQIFNAFPGGQVVNGDQIISYMLAGDRLDYKTASWDQHFGPLWTYDGKRMKGKHTFTFLECYNPILNRGNFHDVFPLEFLDDTRLARFRAIISLSSVKADKVAERGVLKLIKQWRGTTKNPTKDPTKSPTTSLPTKSPTNSPTEVIRRLLRSRQAMATKVKPGQSPCHGGYFANSKGICEPCPVGSYCVNGEKRECYLGTYQAVSGQAKCDKAPCGTFVDVVGAKEASPCAPGMYQPETEQSKCLKAPRGHYTSAGSCEAFMRVPGFDKWFVGNDVW